MWQIKRSANKAKKKYERKNTSEYMNLLLYQCRYFNILAQRLSFQQGIPFTPYVLSAMNYEISRTNFTILRFFSENIIKPVERQKCPVVMDSKEIDYSKLFFFFLFTRNDKNGRACSMKRK